MTTELAPAHVGQLHANGLTLPDSLTIDEAAAVVLYYDVMIDASPWALGDAMVYGEDRFGEEFSQVFPIYEEDRPGHRQSRMKQAAWVARKYPRNQRVMGLSWTHHRAAAELEPQPRHKVLTEALSAGMTTRQLIARVKDVQDDLKAIEGKSDPVCAADDTAWRPTPDQLTEEAAARMRFERTMAGRGASFEQGWCAALAWLEALDCFRRD